MDVKNALIPAAGRGSRLDCPHTVKPLVRLGGIPLIGWNILRLSRLGIENFTIVTGYRAALLEDQLSQLFPDKNIKFVRNENWQEGLGLSVLQGHNNVESPFVLTMSDHLFEEQIFKTLLNDNQPAVKLAVDHKLHEIYDLNDATRVNVKEGKIKNIGKGLDHYNAVDTGLFLADEKLFSALEKQEKKRGKGLTLSDGIRQLAVKGKVGTVDIKEGSWIDIDVPGALVRAEKMVRPEEVPWNASESVVKNVRQKSPANRGQESNELIHPAFHFTTEQVELTEIFFKDNLLKNIDPDLLIPPENQDSPHVLLTDSTVYDLYGEALEKRLTDHGIDLQVLVAAEGEAGKSMDSYRELIGLIFDRGIDAGSYIINLGGGCVCNVGGFIASTLYRGIGLTHIPTTLMAQDDAAIGIKQGLNEARGKNHIGSYYIPERIIVDPKLLQTMDDWLFPDGLSECLKHALGQDREFFDFFQDYEGSIKDPEFLNKSVRKNIELKINLTNSDPKEKKEALVLQYGHTVGHAVEYLSSYQLGHGQSIAVGMVAAAEIALEAGIAGKEIVEKHRHLLRKYDLPLNIPEEISPEDIIKTIRYNKRYRADEMRFVLISEIGSIHSKDEQYQFSLKEEIVRPALERCQQEGEKLSSIIKK